MTDSRQRLFLRQLKRISDACFHLREASSLLKKAKVDDIPDDLDDLSQSLEHLATIIREKEESPPTANVYRISDYQKG